MATKSPSSTVSSVFFDNGIAIMLEACFFFAVFDSLTKYLVNSFSMGEIAFVRFGFGAVMMFPSLVQQRLGIRRKDFFLLLFRGLSGAGAFYLTLLGFQSGALSVTMVLFFTCPLWALFMGALFLEEHLTGERILCVVMAMIGIALLINPWGEGIALSHLYGLAAGIMGGANSVMTRHLRIRHSSQVIYAFHSFVGTLVSIPLITGRIRMPEFVDGTILFIAAVFGLLGQVAMNHGFRFIKAAEGSTIVMTEAILTAMVGIILFHEPFTFTFVVGAMMILGSGIYLGLRTGNDTIGMDRE